MIQGEREALPEFRSARISRTQQNTSRCRSGQETELTWREKTSLVHAGPLLAVLRILPYPWLGKNSNLPSKRHDIFDGFGMPCCFRTSAANVRGRVSWKPALEAWVTGIARNTVDAWSIMRERPYEPSLLLPRCSPQTLEFSY